MISDYEKDLEYVIVPRNKPLFKFSYTIICFKKVKVFFQYYI
jgi:hypothetical protein